MTSYLFKDTCTVLNGTLAWDLDGTYNESTCLDIDPFEIHENLHCVEIYYNLVMGYNINNL